MRHAIIKNGKVVDLIKAEKGFEMAGFDVVRSDDAKIGDTYKNGVFTTPEKEDERTYVEKRTSEYPPIGDQLDALWKVVNQWRLEGQELPQAGDDILNAVLAVKKKYPKDEGGGNAD